MNLPHYDIKQARISYQAPSNIAFIKYWGKRGRQIPMNPSISMTLKNCYTEMTVNFVKTDIQNRKIVSFTFEGQENLQFMQRMENYLESIIDILPWLNSYILQITTRNSFPHSAGIASSASAFAALAMCLEEFDSKLNRKSFSVNHASSLARLGSGSACRSVLPYFTLWGESLVNKSSDDKALALKDIHPVFQTLQDSILIVDQNEKSVGSSAGHALMHGHLFKEVRYQQASDNTVDLINAMKNADMETFGTILEMEALTLHALMMTSNPSYLLLKPASLSIIQKVRQFRIVQNLPLYFTVDAGPNIHLIYPASIKKKVLAFIEHELLNDLSNQQVIHDEIGEGPLKIEANYESK